MSKVAALSINELSHPGKRGKKAEKTRKSETCDNSSFLFISPQRTFIVGAEKEMSFKMADKQKFCKHAGIVWWEAVCRADTIKNVLA